MSYSAITDFLSLLRQTAAGVQQERMPGLDYVVAALSRVGLLNVSIGQTAPTVNQPVTAWFKPAQPSWSAEGVLYLWNAAVQAYQIATPALWTSFLTNAGYAFQSVTTLTGTVTVGTTLLAVQRVNPIATTIVLPNLVSQFLLARKLQVVDFSTAIISHAITLTTADGSTIMQRTSFKLLSTPDNLAGVMLQPSPDLNSWIVAP